MYNKDTRILITGGAGFVGTNFINDLLNRGHNPKCIAVVDNMSNMEHIIPKVHDQIKENFHEGRYQKSICRNILLKNLNLIMYITLLGLVSIYDCND